MEVCLMIEGQEDVTWEDWRAIAAACEEHGVGTLFRSDHLSVDDRRERGSLDAWTTIAALVAADREELRDRAARLSEWKGGDGDGDAFLADLRKGTIAGTVPEALEQLNALERAGLARLMGQHLLHRDLDAIELIGRSVNPALAR